MSGQNAYILELRGRRPGKRIALTRDAVTIGRQSDNHVVIASDAVSRYHARITQSHMQYFVTDLRSRNGTRLNDKPLEPERAYELQHDDKIQIAGSAAVFQFCDPYTTRKINRSEASADGLLLNSEKREVWVDGRKIDPPLSPQQFRLLELLYQHAEIVCARDRVVATVWPGALSDAVSDEMIDAQVSRLRRKLHASGATHEYIVTVRGHGFKFVPRA
ncbi:MAG: FHA domain-containing protein [Chloroflexi bacterium]|nr:FHA domain-containing protein [Chloroflexota bacterium]